MPPQVSVVIPNYNHAPYLGQRIESVLAQTCQDFEIILLDDCSTDGSRGVIEQYRGHPKVAHIVYNEANSGSTFRQWDKGVGLARGEYIWIAESDDWCEPSFLEAMLEGISKDPDCVVSYCQICYVDSQGEIDWISQHKRLSEVVDGGQYIRDYLTKGAISNASMAIWRKDKYALVPRGFTEYRFCGDWLFWIRLAQLGKVHISGRVLNYFRHHHGNVSGNVRGSGYNFLEEMRVIDLLYAEHLIDDRSYRSLFKAKYKSYWRGRRHLDPALLPRIRAAFAAPLSSAVQLWAVKLSALWDEFRPGRRS